MVNDIKPDRTEISLDGDWLFMPEYQLDDKAKALSATTDDEDWHVMQVPNFWNPIRIWLHGEPIVARDIHLIIVKPVRLGIASGWNCLPTSRENN